VVALLIALLFSAGGGEREQYGVAIRLSAEGEHERAAQMLVEVAEKSPDHSLADDALMKAAQIYEERLADPARAAKLYELRIERYPEARAARRAQRRLEVLRRGMGDGKWAEVLGQYQTILTRYSEGDRPGAIAAMKKLVKENPEFPLAGEARLWIASGYRIEGWLDEAADWYARARDGAGEDLAWRADKALADVLLARGDYDGAERLFSSLARDTPVREQVVESSLAKVAKLRSRHHWSIAAWGVVFLFIALMVAVLVRSTSGARGAVRALVRPPTELLFLLPVAAVWTAVAATSNTLVARATVFILAGGLGVTWLSGAATAAARGAAKLSRRRLIAHALAAGVAILAICYIAIAQERLLDLIGETVKFGHDGH